MVASKAVTINVPFVFKALVDSLPAAEMVTTDPVLATIPLSLVLAYGASRATASGLQEWRCVA
jgi:ATP-binding cassette subfamily B (MDR/TAP) protein 7/ABC transporter ATM